MSDTRGMSVAQARMLAADPATPPGVFARLADQFPEVWPTLLANPSVYPELRAWLEASVAAQPDAPVAPALVEPVLRDLRAEQQVAKQPRQKRPSRRRGRSALLKYVTIFLPPVLVIVALFAGANVFFPAPTVAGLLRTLPFLEPGKTNAWSYALAVDTKAECVSYSFQTFAQDRALVLTQNDWTNKDCRKLKQPIASTMALLNVATGSQLWKIDLANELAWTHKWRAEVLNLPGLDQILVRYTNVTGKDVADDDEVVDKTDNRKMKSLVPYSPLNGRVSDTGIAALSDSPLLQAPLLEVIAVPGDSKNVLIMSNGNRQSFRYGHYRAKKLTSADWTYESDLRPVAGNPIADKSLILGREDDDEPLALNIHTGVERAWAGPAGGKLYTVAGSLIHVVGDDSKESVSNEAAQGGSEGHDVTLSGLTLAGKKIWSRDARGYALATYAPSSTLTSRGTYSGLYALSGSKNKKLARVNPATGKALWATNISADHFEVARQETSQWGVLYLTTSGETESKSMVFIDLSDGERSRSLSIPGKSARVDGVTQTQAYLINDPDRARLVNNAESGESTASNGKDESSKERICATALTPQSIDPAWKTQCNGNQHVVLLGGRWLIFDERPAHQQLRLAEPAVGA